jgi:type 1 glutamine amidotransferase
MRRAGTEDRPGPHLAQVPTPVLEREQGIAAYSPSRACSPESFVMPAARSKLAVVVRGGWDGHSPVEATNLFIPHLESNGFEVRIFDSPAPYADAALMAQTALIVQCNTMSTIERDQVRGLKQAIQNGTGMAGWHGGIADSYRDSSEYLHLIGAQFAEHPSLYDPATDTTQGPERNYVPYTVNMLPEAADHPITQGLSDFELVTEQYWVLWDRYLDVLATTTQRVRPWDPWKREVTSPAIWTRQWGAGRIFVCTPGHSLDVLEHSTVRTVVERGLLWASR